MLLALKLERSELLFSIIIPFSNDNYLKFLVFYKIVIGEFEYR